MQVQPGAHIAPNSLKYRRDCARSSAEIAGHLCAGALRDSGPSKPRRRAAAAITGQLPSQCRTELSPAWQRAQGAARYVATSTGIGPARLGTGAYGERGSGVQSSPSRSSRGTSEGVGWHLQPSRSGTPSTLAHPSHKEASSLRRPYARRKSLGTLA